MPFNGSGTFTRLYSWVQDAANGIDILSTRMDNEMNGMATALSDCVTRDGQSPWTANLPAGGFKITGLGTPTSSADSATKGYVDGVVQGEWKAESNSFAWVSGTQFKLTGVDLTAIYHVGRRVKIVHNSGGSTAYATITATAFSTDTTVTVATDNGSALVASITAVSYGIISYVNPSYLDPRSVFSGHLAASQGLTAGTATVLSLATDIDTNSEYVTNTFTAKHPGNYLIIAQATFTLLNAGIVSSLIYKNGSLSSFANLPTTDTVDDLAVVTTGMLSLAAGDFVRMGVQSSSSGTLAVGGYTTFAIARIP